MKLPMILSSTNLEINAAHSIAHNADVQQTFFSKTMELFFTLQIGNTCVPLTRMLGSVGVPLLPHVSMTGEGVRGGGPGYAVNTVQGEHGQLSVPPGGLTTPRHHPLGGDHGVTWGHMWTCQLTSDH